MPARVKDELVVEAAKALVAAAQSMTNHDGLHISVKMDEHQAKSAVMAVLVGALGYPNCILPTGWTEISGIAGFGRLSHGS